MAAIICLTGLLFTQVKDEEPTKTLEDYLANLPKNEEVTKSLMESVVKGNEKVKIYALRALQDQNPDAAYDVFLDYLNYGTKTELVNQRKNQDYSWEIRLESAVGLAEVKNKEAIPRLLRTLRREDNYIVKKGIVYALGELQAEEAVNAIVNVLQRTKEETLVVECVKSLGKIGTKEVFQPLLTVSTGNHLAVTKNEAIKALEKIDWNKK